MREKGDQERQRWEREREWSERAGKARETEEEVKERSERDTGLQRKVYYFGKNSTLTSPHARLSTTYNITHL